jgi:hypothetical protein
LTKSAEITINSHDEEKNIVLSQYRFIAILLVKTARLTRALKWF